jgi:hypothetical protein
MRFLSSIAFTRSCSSRAMTRFISPMSHRRDRPGFISRCGEFRKAVQTAFWPGSGVNAR